MQEHYSRLLPNDFGEPDCDLYFTGLYVRESMKLDDGEEVPHFTVCGNLKRKILI